MKKLAVSKQGAQRFNGKLFNLRKLNELEVRKEYHIGFTNRLTALRNLSDDEDKNNLGEH
jgi:hypothetical protein